MKFGKVSKKLIFSMLCGLIIFISLFVNISLIARGETTHSVNFAQSFQFIEFADENATKTNINSSIELDMPGANWNVTGIELNFTDIKLGRQIVEVETESSGSRLLDKKPKGYAVQFNTSVQTLLYAVEIYGDVQTYATTTNLTIEIQGYNSGSNEPNGTVYGSVNLNMTTDRQWYIQEFSTPISLPAGRFFIVMNGSDMTAADLAKYYWYYNDLSNNTLYTWEYDSGWKNSETTEPFLYKLHQKVDAGYDPEDIEMQAVINGIPYNVSDGAAEAGNLTVITNFNPGSTMLNIPILTNQTIELTFNLSYHLYCQKSFSADGAATLEPSVSNNWIVAPDINRVFDNYTIKFEVPLGWTNVKVYKNALDITGDTVTFGNSLFILNDNITFGSEWEIKATSTNLDFTVNFPVTKFGPDEKLSLSITPPSLQGNVTFTLIDPLDFEDYRDSKSASSGEQTFSYTFARKPREGTWKAFIFWNNNTHAGIKVQDITMTVPFTIDPEVLIMIIIIIAAVAVLGITSYTSVKRIKKKREVSREKIFNKYMDTASLNYIIVTDKIAGLNIYEEFFAGKEVDPTLISGFLDAIKQFGIELSDSHSHSQTLKLDFKDSKILMVEFRNFRLIIILAETPSPIFIESIRALVYDIDNKYGKSLEKFKGETTHFQGIKDLIEDNLQTALISPLKVVKLEKVKISSVEKGLVNRALRIMKETNTKYFFVSSLLSQKKSLDIGDAEVILKLINKKIFQPSE